jgi:hypothetical protein
VTLGQTLKNRRKELGRSLEQVAALTKIHIKILTALEEDHYSELPARAFTRGFIVNYAKALKLDPNQTLETFHDFLEQKFSERPNKDQGHQGYAFEGKELEQNRRWMMVGGSLAAIFAVAVLLVFKPENHKRKEKHKEFEEEVEETTLEPSLSPAPVGSPSPSPHGPLISFTGIPNAVNSSVNPMSQKPFVFSNPTSTPAATATPAPTVAAAMVTPVASPSPGLTPKPDPLNKGDSLTPEEVKFKITFQAKEDVFVRFKSDDRTPGMIILRKGRSLVIKAKQRLLFETNHPENLQYRGGNGNMKALEEAKGELGPDSAPRSYLGEEMGKNKLPDQVPPPKAQ